jgi:hypothetical protein
MWGFSAPGQSKVLLCRTGQVSLSGSNIVLFNAGGTSVIARLRIGGVDYTLVGATVPNTWYHIVVVFNAGVMQLWVNALLAADTSSGGPIAGDMEVAGDFEYFLFGAQQSSVINSFLAVGLSYTAIGPAIGSTAIRENYESAKLSLPISATINVRVVVELDTDQVFPIDFPFTHNFAEPLSGQARPIVEHLSYKTNVLQSEPDYQQRINAQPHHADRALEYFVTPTNSRARAMLQAALWTPGQTYKLPIAKDWGVLTAQATAGASALSLDTTLRDYEIGSYVVVFGNVYQPWTAQFLQITSVVDDELGISPDVGDTLPIGSPIMPARLAILPDDSLSINSHLVDRETHALQFQILSTELSSRRITAYTPSDTYLSIEVFNLERTKVEWLDPSQYQISRRRESTGTATGNDYQRAIDTGSPQSVPIRLLMTSREAIAEFYGWMDARQGKQNPVWIAGQEADLNFVLRVSSTILKVEHIGYAALYGAHSARRHIEMRFTDGTISRHRIVSAVDNGDGTENLQVSASYPLKTFTRISFLRLCTAPDQFELRYHRDGTSFIGETEFVMQELLTTPD